MPEPSEHTYHLHIAGQVQGVGFRPFVWRLARTLGLNGWVNNTTDGVHVVFNAPDEQAKAFEAQVLAQAPALSCITAHRLERTGAQEFDRFEILLSAGDAPPDLLLTPDFGLCADCRRELRTPANRRFGYPFITCTNCGPRFSIVTALPYDRERTAMRPFTQCSVCQAEYENPADRRYFSQTNSCPDCGIRLSLRDAAGAEIGQPLDTALNMLRSGKILAVKGIGGYLLLCDATDAGALETLRLRKRRPTKPFALLYRDIPQLEGDAVLLAGDQQLLQSPAAPIVLLQLQEKPASGLCGGLVAPGLDQIGAMLPYAPLLDLLACGMDRPLVATSGNVSGAPIIFSDEKAQGQLAAVADAVLAHNRAIAIPQDDSVLRFSPVHRQKMVLRRSRGYAPTFLFEPPFAFSPASGSVLALGATMKSAFAWLHRGNWYVSQYLGDLESFDTQEAFEHTVQHFLDLLCDRPAAIVVDRHPDYFSTHLGLRMASDWNLPVRQVQHHVAHFAAVLAENGRYPGEKPALAPVLGVIWDGTGYGDDGQVWGGEFFRFDGQSIDRVGHFEPFDFLLGDKMPREPRISALSLAHALEGGAAALQPKFSTQEWALYNKMLQKGGLLRTTSVGRLFDGVASLLGLGDRMSYEGEAALLLEQAATRYFRREGLTQLAPCRPETQPEAHAPTRALVQEVLSELHDGASVEKIAALFHLRLIELIRRQAQRQDCRVLAFSGGVWQNALLTDLALEYLRPEFELLFHRQLSPNDEGVSFGQLIAALTYAR